MVAFFFFLFFLFFFLISSHSICEKMQNILFPLSVTPLGVTIQAWQYFPDFLQGFSELIFSRGGIFFFVRQVQNCRSSIRIGRDLKTRFKNTYEKSKQELIPNEKHTKHASKCTFVYRCKRVVVGERTFGQNVNTLECNFQTQAITPTSKRIGECELTLSRAFMLADSDQRVHQKWICAPFCFWSVCELSSRRLLFFSLDKDERVRRWSFQVSFRSSRTTFSSKDREVCTDTQYICVTIQFEAIREWSRLLGLPIFCWF